MNICFRFDIDTPACIQYGISPLLRLAKSLDTPFTFFLNPGRAVCHFAALSRKRGSYLKPSLSARRKLGTIGWVRTALLNPALSHLRETELLAEAKAQGHEIGLHGGRNHGRWQRDAHRWSRDKILSEVRWGLKAFERLGLNGINSFASPGWTTSDYLPFVLAQEGFKTLADRYGKSQHGYTEWQGHKLALVATALTGEPGGVGYLEASFARGWSTEKTIDHFLSEATKTAVSDIVVYDHPCFAGREGLPRLVSMIEACRDERFDFTTIDRIGERVLRASNSPQIAESAIGLRQPER